MFSWIPSLEPSASDVDGWDEEGIGTAESVEVVDSDEDAELEAEVLVAEDTDSDALKVSSESKPHSEERAVLDSAAEAGSEIEIEAVAEAGSADPAKEVEFAGSTA